MKEGVNIMNDDNNIIFSVEDFKIYDNDIDLAIDNACQQLEIDDLRKEGQRRWKAVLQLVGKQLFSNKKILRSRELKINEGNKIPTNNNRYDYNILNSLCDYYIYISNKYNKFVSIEGFSYFTNIPMDSIINWKDNKDLTGELNNLSYQIYEKITHSRLENIKDNALDNPNVTGTIAVGNWEYQLNMPGVKTEQQTISAKNSEEIAMRYGIIGFGAQKKALKAINNPDF